VLADEPRWFFLAEVSWNLWTQVAHFEKDRNTSDQVGAGAKNRSRTGPTGSAWPDVTSWNPIAASYPKSVIQVLPGALIKALKLAEMR
jgi:hypothetical protein